jgi:uncharacterized protein (TIGR02598 family)
MRRRRGFTLMEVMLAVFIISVALVSLQSVIAGGLLSAGNSVNRRAARELCRRTLETAVATDESSPTSGTDQTYGFRWSVDRQEQTVGVGQNGQPSEKIWVVTARVDYTVEAPDGSGGSTSKEETVLLSTIMPDKDQPQ